MTCLTPRYRDIPYSHEFSGERSTGGERSPEVDLLHRGAAEVDENALTDAVGSDRMRGERQADPSAPVADVDATLLIDLAQFGCGAAIPSLRVV
jgi:hypothetical protein